MYCSFCGANIPDDSEFCPACGKTLEAQPESQVQEPEQPQYQPAPQAQPEQPQYQPAPQAQPYQGGYQQPAPQVVVNNYVQTPAPPARLLKTNKALWKYILFGIITFGIYEIVYFSSISTSLNTAASRYDGKKTMHFCLVFFIFSWLTFGIVPLVWFHKMSGRVGRELKRRGIAYSFGAGSFWLWNVLGSMFVAGPFIYIHKLSKAMNKICADYNVRG